MRKKNRRSVWAVILAFILLLSMQINVFAAQLPDGGGTETENVTAEESLYEESGNADDNTPDASGETESLPETEVTYSESPEESVEADPEPESVTESVESTPAETESEETESEENAENGISLLAAGDYTVNVGATITLDGRGGWFTSTRNHVWASSSDDVATVSGSSSTATVKGISEGKVTIVHTYEERDWRGRWQDRKETFNVTVTRAGTIEVNVYLRYDNNIPGNVNRPEEAAEYGPAGNDTPYLTITIDLDDINKRTQSANSGSYVYYSIDSDSSYNTGDRKSSAENFWEQVIWPAIASDDQQALTELFGADQYIGYVLKLESSGWHLDGVLREDPPNYLVELYDTSDKVLFTMTDNNTVIPGVSYEAFKERLETELGGENYQYAESDDNIIVTYTVNGVQYQTTIKPRSDSEYYHIYPSESRFGYRTVSQNVFYICRLVMTTEQISGDLTLSKTVSGSAANPNEHFTFTLTKEGINGTYSVTYSGTDGCDESHGQTIVFTNGTATLVLKDGESAAISGLPTGTINIKEATGQYQTSYTINGGEVITYIESGADVSISSTPAAVNFVNKLDAQPVTGLRMDSLPYIGGAAIVLTAGMIFLFMGRKKINL